jgi:hypothetical protein
MKTTIHLFIIACAFSFTGCLRGHSPQAVAASFLSAFKQKKYDEAKKYCTPQTVKLVEVAESLDKNSTAKVEYMNKQYEVLSQEIKGDTAYVKFKEKGSDEIDTMILKKTKGEWMVAISKEDIMSKHSTEENAAN